MTETLVKHIKNLFHLAPKDCKDFSEEQLLEAEKQLAVKFPLVFREYYLQLGATESVNQSNLQQRFDTILRVSQMIVLLQQEFFDQGPQAMQPLALREVAQALELHESTISRVTNGKFMATPWGTFELKYFFSSSLQGKDGHTTSGTAVRALLQQLIAEESPTQPLSDNRLCELLQEQGIQCARRTVAKYREALRIPPAHLRKTLQEK